MSPVCTSLLQIRKHNLTTVFTLRYNYIHFRVGVCSVFD